MYNITIKPNATLKLSQTSHLSLNIHRRHPNIPIVQMTAYADVKLAVKGLKSGAVDLVTKPWDNHELIRVLKDAIDTNTEVIPLEKMEEEHVRKVADKCHGNVTTCEKLE